MIKSFFGKKHTVAGKLPPGRGLFVVGAARSGTTILQDALNHAPDICLLSEPDLHMESDAPGFAARFNAMHHSWHNQQTKGTYLPVLGAQDGAWQQHLDDLSKVYHWVGTKIVVSPRPNDPQWLVSMRAFQNRHFFTSRYIFTFRDPVAVMKSTMSMRGHESGDVTSLAQNYAEVISLFTQMARTMPHVRAVVHEDINASTFDDLGKWLGVSLEGAHTYYQPEKVVRHTSAGFEGPFAEKLDLLDNLYQNLRRAVAGGFERPQIQQNDLKLYSGQKPETLGLLDSQARFIAKG